MPHIALNPVNDNALQIYKTPVYYFTSGYNYSLNNNFNVKPSFLIKYLQFSNMQVDINTMVNYKNIISVGASYRTGNAIMLLTEIKYHHLKFGYAYDYYLNSLKKVSNGSHELMFKYEFHYLVKVIDPRNFY